MSVLSLHFVRHAPVIGQDGIAYGRDAAIDTHCTDKFTAAATLLPRNCAIWIASEFDRAQRTAKLLQAQLGEDTTLDINPAFNEQDFGDLVGHTKQEIKANPANASYLSGMLTIAPPGGESIPQMVERVRAGLNVLAADMRTLGQNKAVIVCHGGVIRAVDSLYHRRPFQLDLKVPHLSVHKFRMSALSL